MSQQPQQIDAKYVKERLIKYLNEKGPSLPVNLAKHVGLNSLFTSAFLSELSAEGLLKISDMKVGGSPLYFTASKFAMLENFISHLNIREREACTLLKERSILNDQEQTPVIRVALRGLKDFAIPIKKDEKLFWRYFLVSEEQASEKISLVKKPEVKPEIKQEVETKIEEIKEQKTEEKEEQKSRLEKQASELEKVNVELEQKRRELDKLRKDLLNFQKEKKEQKKLVKTPKKKPNLKSEKFLNEIKETLVRKNIELINVEQYNPKEVYARIKVRDIEYLLAAYDKKKIESSDIMRAYKKSLTLNLPYYIISKGDTSKKTKEIIEAYKKLTSIEALEDTTKNNKL